MRGLIISSGQIRDYNLLKKNIEENDYIVCADGGVNHILKTSKFPDIVLGDLDSIGKEELKILKENSIEIIKYSSKKDETDTELCVNFLLDKGFSEITMMGVTGTRIDHMIANIYLLKKIYSLGALASIIDDNNEIYYTDNRIILSYKKDYFVSIIPLTDEGVEVSLNGFLYPLEKEYLKFGSTRGISNKIIKDIGEINIHKGNALIIASKD